MVYKKGAKAIILSEKVKKGELHRPPDAEEVDLNGNLGYYTSYGTMGILTWRCGDLELSFNAAMPKEEFIKIAKSVEC